MPAAPRPTADQLVPRPSAAVATVVDWERLVQSIASGAPLLSYTVSCTLLPEPLLLIAVPATADTLPPRLSGTVHQLRNYSDLAFALLTRSAGYQPICVSTFVLCLSHALCLCHALSITLCLPVTLYLSIYLSVCVSTSPRTTLHLFRNISVVHQCLSTCFTVSLILWRTRCETARD